MIEKFLDGKQLGNSSKKTTNDCVAITMLYKKMYNKSEKE